MIFHAEKWTSATAWIDPKLVAGVETWSLALAAKLPANVTAIDVNRCVPVETTFLKTALQLLRQACTQTEGLPPSSTLDAPLVLWALGLARHVTRKAAPAHQG